MSWAPMQLVPQPRGKPRPAGPFLRQHPSRGLGIKHPPSGRFNRPRTLPTGGMSYSKLPSGACRLIRSLGVSRLADVQETESNISPITSCRQLLILQAASRCRTANPVGERLANRAGATGAGLWAGGVPLG